MVGKGRVSTPRKASLSKLPSLFPSKDTIELAFLQSCVGRGTRRRKEVWMGFSDGDLLAGSCSIWFDPNKDAVAFDGPFLRLTPEHVVGSQVPSLLE